MLTVPVVNAMATIRVAQGLRWLLAMSVQRLTTCKQYMVAASWGSRQYPSHSMHTCQLQSKLAGMHGVQWLGPVA